MNNFTTLNQIGNLGFIDDVLAAIEEARSYPQTGVVFMSEKVTRSILRAARPMVIRGNSNQRRRIRARNARRVEWYPHLQKAAHAE